MAGIHQTLKEVRDLYAEALKLQEAVSFPVTGN